MWRNVLTISARGSERDDQLDVVAHDVGHPQGGERRRLGRLLPYDPRRSEALDVDRILLEGLRGDDREHGDDHHREDDRRVLSELEDHDDREERCSRHSGEKASHAEQGVSAHGGVEGGKERVGDLRDRASEGRAHHERRSEHASDASGSDRRARRHDLSGEEQRQMEKRRIAAEDPVGALEPVAPDLRQKDPERADDRASERHRERDGQAGDANIFLAKRRERTKRAEQGPAASPIAAKGISSSTDSRWNAATL